jgi:hypothetical protein
MYLAREPLFGLNCIFSESSGFLGQCYKIRNDRSLTADNDFSGESFNRAVKNIYVCIQALGNFELVRPA